MAKFVDEMAEFGGISAKFGEIWRGTGGIRRKLAVNCEILAESGGKERTLAKYFKTLLAKQITKSDNSLLALNRPTQYRQNTF